MFLNIEKSGEQDKERSEEWLVKMGPDVDLHLLQTKSLLSYEQSP